MARLVRQRTRPVQRHKLSEHVPAVPSEHVLMMHPRRCIDLPRFVPGLRTAAAGGKLTNSPRVWTLPCSPRRVRAIKEPAFTSVQNLCKFLFLHFTLTGWWCWKLLLLPLDSKSRKTIKAGILGTQICQSLRHRALLGLIILFALSWTHNDGVNWRVPAGYVTSFMSSPWWVCLGYLLNYPNTDSTIKKWQNLTVCHSQWSYTTGYSNERNISVTFGRFLTCFIDF